MKRLKALTAMAALCPLAAPGIPFARTPYPADPLQSPMWTAHAQTIFGDDPVRFDTRIRVSYPGIAENQRNFPVALDARGIAVSTKSACREGKESQSHVVRTLGGGEWRAKNTLRFSLGRDTRKKDIRYMVQMLTDILKETS